MIFQFSSIAQSCLTLCDPMNRSAPGLPVHHHLLEFTQTQVHRVHDAIQPSHHPLLLPPPIPPSIRVFSNESTFRMRWPKNEFRVVLLLYSISCYLQMVLLLLSRFSCVRLWDPIDSSPPGSPIPGILQARTLEWVAISFFNA